MLSRELWHKNVNLRQQLFCSITRFANLVNVLVHFVNDFKKWPGWTNHATPSRLVVGWNGHKHFLSQKNLNRDLRHPPMFRSFLRQRGSEKSMCSGQMRQTTLNESQNVVSETCYKTGRKPSKVYRSAVFQTYVLSSVPRDSVGVSGLFLLQNYNFASRQNQRRHQWYKERRTVWEEKQSGRIRDWTNNSTALPATNRRHETKSRVWTDWSTEVPGSCESQSRHYTQKDKWKVKEKLQLVSLHDWK